MSVEYCFDWASCVRISDQWVKENLCDYYTQEINSKVIIRNYCLQFSGTEYEINGLVECVADSIKYFVFSPDKIRQMEREGKEPYRKAVAFFGKTDPEKDGKYGELILFLFTESILKTPMIAHKIESLTNVRDQVKGGDGIFFGEYNGRSALLVGEAKIEQEFGQALTHAFDSLNRFHGALTAVATTGHELIIASNLLREDLSVEQLDYLFNSMKVGTKEYKNKVMVHPVLIIYNDNTIENIEKEALDAEDGNSRLGDYICGELQSVINKVEKRLQDYADVSKVYLDFFFLPVTNVKKLRYALYEAIHGVPY